MDEILRLEDLSFRYGEEKVWALKEVSLAVSHGEKIAVLGNNGAGKSTFFRCCNGILRPGEGSLYLKGEKITWRKQEILDLRQTVGLIFQEADHQLIAGTVEEEISFGPMNLKLPEEEVRSRVDASLEAMDLSEYRKRAPHELSGGEKKRVSIADILAMEPELMPMNQMKDQVSGQETTDGYSRGNVYGTYIHGIFDRKGVAEGVAESLAEKKGVSLKEIRSKSLKEWKEEQYDLLADALREHLDMKAIYQILEEEE